MSPEKREFIQLFQASGWSQAEAARHLGLSRAAVNAIITGDNSPSAVTIRLFKLILLSEKPAALKPSHKPDRLEEIAQRIDLDELGTDLAMLPAEQRQAMIKALRAVVQAALPKSKY